MTKHSANIFINIVIASVNDYFSLLGLDLGLNKDYLSFFEDLFILFEMWNFKESKRDREGEKQRFSIYWFTP